MTFQVNHLGHFLLTELLRDRLVASAPSRVIVVASDAHKSARHGLDFDDLQSARRYRSFGVYGKTKLANILFTRELARRLAGTGVTVNSVHPGFVASRFGRDGDTGLVGKLMMPLTRPFALNATQGAQTSIYLASDPAVEGITGAYWVKCAPVEPSDAALDDDAARAPLGRQRAARPRLIKLASADQPCAGLLTPVRYCSGRSVGNSTTSRMLVTPARSMTRRSMPRPMPPVGGIPYSRARR